MRSDPAAESLPTAFEATLPAFREATLPAFRVDVLEPGGDRKSVSEARPDGKPSLLNVASSAKCDRELAADLRQARSTR